MAATSVGLRTTTAAAESAVAVAVGGVPAVAGVDCRTLG